MLQKDSLLYTKFIVLNELNNLKSNEKAISVATKQAIYRDLFLSGKKVTQAKLRTYLGLGKEDELTGFDQEMKALLHPGSTMRGCWSARVDLRRWRRSSAISRCLGKKTFL